VQAHPQKFLLGEKPGKIPENPGKICGNLGKYGAQRALI